jgi:hypothetical protein
MEGSALGQSESKVAVIGRVSLAGQLLERLEPLTLCPTVPGCLYRGIMEVE